MIYKKRFIEEEFNPLFDVFQIIGLTGPRQSGKSTLLKNFFKKDWAYYNLDDRSLASRIRSDPEAFVKNFVSNVIIDEAQKVPDLFHSIKALVDSGFKYKFILSGSANFLLMKQITESLAGRIGILELFPYSISESLSIKQGAFIESLLKVNKVEELYKKLTKLKMLSFKEIINFILYGGFPKIHNLKPHRAKLEWFQNYITTYIERDLRDLANIQDLDSFQAAYNMLFFQTANLLNMSNISSDIGLNLNTVKKYIMLLEVSYQFKKLQPFSFSKKKSLVKTPKIFSLDTGLTNYVLKNYDEDRLLNSGFWGNLLESWAFSEFYKTTKNMVPRPALYFYRTRNEAEVDLVIEYGNKLIPVEIKGGVNINPYAVRGIKTFMESFSKKEIPFGIIVYRGSKVEYLDKKILAVPMALIY